MKEYKKGIWYRCKEDNNKAGRFHHLEGNCFYCDAWISRGEYQDRTDCPTWINEQYFDGEIPISEIAQYLPKGYEDLNLEPILLYVW